MSGVVVRFERRVATLAVITKLVEFGYLQPGARHRATAVEKAIDRLRSDLVRQGVICDSNLSSSPQSEDQQGLLGTQIGERGLALAKAPLPAAPAMGLSTAKGLSAKLTCGTRGKPGGPAHRILPGRRSRARGRKPGRDPRGCARGARRLRGDLPGAGDAQAHEGPSRSRLPRAVQRSRSR
jgi:hypothetical protein